MRNEPEMVRFLSGIKPGNVATVPPVVAEIEYGIRRLDNTFKKYALLAAQKERLLTVIRVLPWDEQSSVNFGSIKADVEKAGTPIDDFDAAIAAIAMSHDAEVLTANLTHFQIIKGLASRRW